MPRLFSGLELPQALCTRLSFIRASLPGSRWISPENYHITLRFIGDVDDAVADDFAYALRSATYPSFSLRLLGLGAFGHEKPRSLWAGLEASTALTHLYNTHDTAARRVGLPAEGRNFTPHVTLARLKGTRSGDVARFLESFGDFASEPFQVNRFVLFSSRPGRGGGPYVVEASYPLEADDTMIENSYI